MKYSLFFLILFLSSSICSQQIEQASKGHSAESANQQKIAHTTKEWSGTIDGVHEIEITLQIEDNKCKGEFILLSSNQKFQLEGSIENGKYVLQEIDENLKITGNLNFEKISGKTTGIWNQPLGNVFLRLDLEPKKLNNDYVNACDQNNSHKKYFGTIDNSNFQVNITKENNTNLKVDLIIDKILIEGVPSCKDSDCKHFIVQAKEIAHIYKELNFKSLADDKMILFVEYPDGTNKQVRLQLDTKLRFDCQSFANYQERFEIVYPQINHAYFNKFITQLIEDLRELDAEKKEKENYPENRFLYTTSLWTDILFYSDKYISGIITKQDNYSGKNKRVAFTIDLKNNKMIEIKDLFKKAQYLDQKTESFLSDHRKNYRPFKEKGIEDWIMKEQFEYVNIHDKGFSLTSSFSNIYGEKQIIISFEEIKHLLRKDFKKAMDID